MRVPLLGGAYEARSIIANAQRCVNLFPEIDPQSSEPPTPVTHYQTPGLDLLIAGPSANPVRCLYQASNGELFAVIGSTLYFISSNWTLNTLGTVAPGGTPVSMADNGLAVIVVDGSPVGYAIDLNSHQFGTISDPNFMGADRADYVDTYFLLNRPNTNQFYISLSLVDFSMLVSGTAGTAFDPLDTAAKVGYPDPLATLIVMHREIWLIGQLTTEIWYNSGAADFTFQLFPGSNIIQHGAVAPYSIATQDVSVYWLSQDKQGQGIIMRGKPYEALRISTHALENEFLTYPTLIDAIGFTYQLEGHTFYVLTFPTANKTWAYDQATELWHEWAYTDNNGNLNRHRANACANAYGKVVVGDWENGNIYALNLNTYTDNGQPISRIRSFPHLVNEGKRIFYPAFQADMSVGNDDGSVSAAPPVVSLRWSDNRGASYGNKMQQSLGAAGQYLTSVQFSRLGMARDRVFELSWSADADIALQGAWIQTQMAGT